MPKYRLRVKQSFKLIRSIGIDVEAVSLSAALAIQADSDAPPDDAGWLETRVMEHEECEYIGYLRLLKEDPT